MWLPYGIDQSGGFVHIDEVPRGKTALGCPYCTADLTARKGRIKAHHFAHTETTCRAVDRRDVPTLPFYDRFDLGLSPKAIMLLHEQWERYGVHNRTLSVGDLRQSPAAFVQLRRTGCIVHNPYHGRYGGYEFTKVGKIPVGMLSLRLFAEEQEEHMLLKLLALERHHELSRSDTEREQAAVDLRLYQHQYHRVLSSTLYFLVVQADDLTLYKIGVTRRSIDERLEEIKRDLSAFFIAPDVRVVDTWPHRGSVEYYFKHRYRASRYTALGTLTEYFQFDNPGVVTRELRRMKAKEWEDKEQEILKQQYLQASQRSCAIRSGMQRVAARGVHIGRPKGSESAEVFLSKPSSLRVITALAQNLSLRRAAAQAEVSVGTVRKVKALIQENAAEEFTS